MRFAAVQLYPLRGPSWTRLVAPCYSATLVVLLALGCASGSTSEVQPRVEGGPAPKAEQDERAAATGPKRLAAFVSSQDCDLVAPLWPGGLCASYAQIGTRVRIDARAENLANPLDGPHRIQVDGKVVASKGDLGVVIEDEPASNTIVYLHVEPTEAQAMTLASAAGASNPIRWFRLSVSKLESALEARFECEATNEADAVALETLLEKGTRDDTLLEIAGIGDFSGHIRSASLTRNGQTTVLQVQMPATDLRALVRRAAFLEPRLPEENTRRMSLFLHEDGRVSSGLAFARAGEVKTLVDLAAKGARDVRVDYPPGTSHDAITDVVALLRGANLTAHVATTPLTRPAQPPLAPVDTSVVVEDADAMRGELMACASDEAKACHAFAKRIERTVSSTDAEPAYRRSCELEVKAACAWLRRRGLP